tara:strand:+ start:46682 stop:48016 length:1335 start_codon:yes stop_codon:yes gene_type:complete
MKKNRIVILGCGESGIGSTLLALKKGYNIYVSDNGIIREKYKKILKINKIIWEENTHNRNKLIDADLVVKSPGISNNNNIIKFLIKNKIPVISEIEFAYKNTDAKLICITGTNGKTTTSALIYKILKDFGFNVGLAGNIGDSFAKKVANGNFDYYVLEISSFQLDDIVDFKPDIAVITNISNDHLDHYNNNFEKYLATKLKIFMNQNEDDFLVYNSDDKILKESICNKNIKSNLYEFGFKEKKQGTYFKNGKIISKKKTTTMINSSELSLRGRHNLLNAMAAISVAKLLSIDKISIRESLQNFKGLEHRLEFVLKIHNITYVNDSKATNLNATQYALDSMKNQTIWIAGGIDKGNDYNQILPLVREKVRGIICIGLNNEKIKKFFTPIVEFIHETQKMDDAVKIANRIANKKEFVLLSPACSSYDIYQSYEDRGNKFKNAVRNL